MFCRQHRSLRRLILALKVITDVLHLHPLDARLAADILDQSLQHENHMWMTTDVRVDGHREAEIVILPIKEVKMISPQVLNVFWIHPAVGVGGFLDEHHGGEVIKIPVGWDLDQTSVRAFLQRLHPVVGVFAVVDWGPFVAGAEVVG